MNGETVATIHWRALDRDGEDKCRLARLDLGWMLVGHARFRDATGWSALDYVIRVGADWCTTSADITGDYGGEAVALRLARELEVDHAGFDIALVEGYPYVLEFNRLFGNQGLGQGSDLKTAILDYLQRQAEPEDPNGPTGPAPLWPVAV